MIALITCMLFAAAEPFTPQGMSFAVAAPPALIVMAACWVAAGRVRSSQRKAWILMAAAMTANAVGDVSYEIIQRHLGEEPGVSLADAFYLPMYPLLLLGFARMIRRRSTDNIRDVIIDSATVSLLMGMVMWQVFVVQPGWASDVGLLERVVFASYPLGDILVLGAVVAALFTRSRRDMDRLAIIAFGVAMLAADTLYLWGNAYTTNGALLTSADAAFTLSYGLLAAAALLQPYTRRRGSPERQATLVPMRLTMLTVSLCGAPLYAATAVLLDFDIEPAAFLTFTALLSSLAITRVVMLVRSLNRRQRDLEASQRELSHQALHDSLTGIANRAFIASRLEQLGSDGFGDSAPYSLMYLDLDDFKLVNDSLGHLLGDELLRVVARRLTETVRIDDVVGRAGGDEFVIIAPDTPLEAARTLASRVLAAIREPVQLGETVVHPGASIGIACGERTARTRDLLADADLALYAAKDSDTRIACFEPHLRYAATVRTAIGIHLRSAIEQQDLRLHYQPLVDMESGRIRSVEALLRWPQRPDLPIPRVIEVAERSGLMHSLGEFVVETACRELAQINRMRPPDQPISVAVNVSMRQLEDDALLNLVRDAIDRHGLQPDHFTLELTETSLASESTSIELLRQFRTAGMRVALDDFGTGYSSLGRLANLPLDVVKLDRSFIAALEKPSGRAVFAAMAELSRAFGFDVVAEGIETHEQAESVQLLGCRIGQGYLYGRPMPADDLMGIMITGTAPAII